MKTVYKVDKTGKKELMQFGTYSNAKKFINFHFGTIEGEVQTTTGLDEVYDFGTFKVVVE